LSAGKVSGGMAVNIRIMKLGGSRMPFPFGVTTSTAFLQMHILQTGNISPKVSRLVR
jgi:hypothetical protein